jgi:hypothetical protein
MPVWQFPVIDRVGARGGDDEHCRRNGFEIGTEMDRALEGHDPLLPGLDAEMPEHGLVRRLLLAA